MPKATTPTALRQARRHNPLEDDILATGPLRTKAPKRKSRDLEERGNGFIDSVSSKKILKIGRELIDEDAEEGKQGTAPDALDLFGFDPRYREPEREDNDDSVPVYADDDAWGDEDDEMEEVEVNAQDLETWKKYFPESEDPLLTHGWDRKGPAEEKTEQLDLGALIMEKIAAHEAGMDRRQAVAPAPDEEYELPEKVVEVYSKVGLFLSRYKSGKLPKPFKILPTVPHWEDIIQVTNPPEWTPNACYEATKIFVAGKPVVAQRFMEMILLDRVRDDIHETKKLNVHLFNALKKGLYKPAAWFKGFLFPLVGSGTCTLREAHIISAVLARVSVPILHSAAATERLCEIAAQEASQGTEGGGATNIFIKTLLEKKYALPYKVVDSLVFHFLRFRSVDPASIQKDEDMDIVANDRVASRAKLPVIWHQCLLAFAQRYRNEITEDQRESLLDLLLTHGHSKIGPEVRRELLAGRGRGIPAEAPAAEWDGDDTMLVDS